MRSGQIAVRHIQQGGRERRRVIEESVDLPDQKKLTARPIAHEGSLTNLDLHAGKCQALFAAFRACQLFIDKRGRPPHFTGKQ